MAQRTKFVAARQHDQKLLAADAPHSVVTPDNSVKAPDNLPQRLVPRRMTPRVIDLLEMVQIKHHHPKVPLLPFRPVRLTLQRLKNHPPVPAARQRIPCRLFAQRLLRQHQFALQIQDPAPGPQPHLQLMLVKRLHYIVVRPSAHALDYVLTLAPGGQQKQVSVCRRTGRPDHLADFGPGKHRHHPVQDRQPRRIVALQTCQSLRAISGTDDFKIPTLQRRLQEPAHYKTVVGDQNSHSRSLRASRPGYVHQNPARCQPPEGFIREFRTLPIQPTSISE